MPECTACKSPFAYVGLSEVECPNPDCELAAGTAAKERAKQIRREVMGLMEEVRKVEKGYKDGATKDAELRRILERLRDANRRLDQCGR